MARAADELFAKFIEDAGYPPYSPQSVMEWADAKRSNPLEDIRRFQREMMGETGVDPIAEVRERARQLFEQKTSGIDLNGRDWKDEVRMRALEGLIRNVSGVGMEFPKDCPHRHTEYCTDQVCLNRDQCGEPTTGDLLDTKRWFDEEMS